MNRLSINIAFAVAAVVSVVPAYGEILPPVVVPDHNIDLQRVIPMRHRAPAISSSRSATPLQDHAAVSLAGALTYSTDWSADALRPTGVYAVDMSGELLSAVPVALDERLDARGGAVMTPDGYFVTGVTEYMGYYLVDHYLFDSYDWHLISRFAGDMESMARCLTYSPADGKIYGCFVNLDGSFSFSTINTSTGVRKKITPRMENSYCAMAASPEGVLYAISAEGNLLTLDPKKGTEIAVAEFSTPSAYATSAVFNPADGHILYVCAAEDGSILYDIDPAEGQALLLGTFDAAQQWSGLFIQPAAAADMAPSAPSDAEWQFEADSLDGTVSFTLPVTLFDGTPIAEETTLAWTVTAEGETIAEGTGMPGESITAQVSFSAPDRYNVAVYVSNEAGQSPAQTSVICVGPDVPESVSNVNLNFDAEENRITISWDAPEQGIYEGWFDPAQLSYDIVRHPGAETVAEGITDTSWSCDAMADGSLTVWSYDIISIHSGRRGAAVRTEPLPLGNILPPWQETFDTEASVAPFLIVDRNGDGVTWSADPEAGAVTIGYSRQDMDDWLITPPVCLKAGEVYPVSVQAWGRSTLYEEKIALWMGASMSADAMTQKLGEAAIKGRARPMDVLVTVERDGEYCFGVQGCSPAAQYVLHLDGISFGESFAQDAPKAPEAFEVKADPTGELTAIGTVTAPLKANDGSPLAVINAITVSRGEDTVAVIENPTPGETYTFTDEFKSAGRFDYTAVAETAAGVGAPVSTSIFAGVNIPANPAVITADILDGSTDFVLRWEVPEIDHDGFPLNTDDVTYEVFDKNFNKVAETGTETTCIVPVTYKDSPSAEIWFVKATTPAGTNDRWDASTGIVNSGVWYDGIWRTHELDIEKACVRLALSEGLPTDAARWHPVLISGSEPDCYRGESLDLDDKADSGVIVLSAVKMGDNSPWLSFDFDYLSDISAEVYVLSEGVWHHAGSSEDHYDEASKAFIFPLDNYAGKEVNIAILGTGPSGSYVVVDHISVECIQKHDLRLQSIELDRGSFGTRTGHVKVANKGSEAMGPFTVEVFEELSGRDEPLGTLNVETIDAGTDIDFQFTVEFPYEAGTHTIIARLTGLADNEPRWNEISKDFNVENKKLPRPMDGAATAEADLRHVNLRWTRPAGVNEAGECEIPKEGRVKLIGYKILDSDKKRIGETPAGITEFRAEVTQIPEPGERFSFKYYLVAVYDAGESSLSSPVKVELSGIEAVSATESFRVKSDKGEVVISGTDAPVNVYTADGRLIRTLPAQTEGQCVSERRLTLPAGIYLLTSAGRTRKLTHR